MVYAINASKTIVSISLQNGNGLLTLTKCDQGLGDIAKDSESDIQSLIPAEVWGEFDPDITFDFELQLSLRITYSYTDPDVFTDGDYSDSGYLTDNIPYGTVYYPVDFDTPMGLAAYSGDLNDLKKIDPDMMFDFYQLQKFAELTMSDYSGRETSLPALIAYLTELSGHEWYSAIYDGLSIGVQHV